MNRNCQGRYVALLLVALGIAASGCRDDAPKAKPSPVEKDMSAWRRSSDAEEIKSPTSLAPPRSDALPMGVASKTPPAPDRRLEPIPGWNPTHVTVRLMRKVAVGDWDLGDLLSDNRGLVFVDNRDGPLAAKRYCGAGLSKGSQEAMSAFQELLDRLEHEGTESIRCSNEPRPPTCYATEHGHQGAIFFRFADGDRGIELVAIYRLALGALSDLEGEKLQALEASIIQKADDELSRLGAEPCERTK